MNTGALPSRWNLKSWREPGAGTHQEPQLFIMSELLFSAFVRGPKTPGGNAVSEGTAAAWFLPHLPTVQKNKKKQKAICLSRLSCDTFLSVSSTTLLEKKKRRNHPPFGFSTVPALVIATQRYNRKPLQAKDFTRALRCWQLTQGALLKMPSLLVRTASRFQLLHWQLWEESADRRVCGGGINTLTLNAFNQ